jgi:hypothetical protein
LISQSRGLGDVYKRQLDDPAGQGVDAVRPIRDAVRAKVEALIAEIDAK